MKASVRREIPMIEPMVAGFIPSPKFRTIAMLPMAPPNKLLVSEPRP